MLNYSLTKNLWMSTGKKTVSPEALQAEWLEIEAAQRDPALFRPLYNRYYEPVFRLIFRRTADEALTADLCSQAFLKAIQKLPDYEFKGVPFSSWLFRIAINETAQHFREAQRHRVVSIEDATLQQLMTEIDEPAADDTLQWDLVGALDQLKDTDLTLIELRFFEQRPFKEIAEILGMTESNAKLKTYRILERLKKKLTP